MRNLQNVILSHLSQDVNSLICKCLEKYSGVHFNTEVQKMPRFDKIGRIPFMLLYMGHALKLFFKRKRIGIIVSWSDYIGGMFFACFCRLFHVKKHFTLILMAFIYNHQGRGIKHALKMRITQYAVCSKYVDYIVVFSQGEIDYYHKLLNIPKSKLYFFPLSKNMDTFIPQTLSIKEEKYIFSVGSTNRDYDFLINTMGHTKHKVHIACNMLAEKQNVSNIIIHNNLFGNEMQQYMHNCYCVAIPLKGNLIISSGQLVLLQAMYLKRPIVCTKGSCVANYLKDGHNALLVNNKQEDWLTAIEKLYNDKELYNRLAENAYKDYMEKHRTEVLAKNIASLIK